MKLLTEEELKKMNHPLYEKKVREMRGVTDTLLGKFNKTKNWTAASLKDQQDLFSFFTTSHCVAAIKVNGTIFQGSQSANLHDGHYLAARKRLIKRLPERRLAPPEFDEAFVYVQRPREVSKAAHYGSFPPRGEISMLCFLLGYEEMGYINPSERITVWCTIVGEKVSFDKIVRIALEQTKILLFEHPLFIVSITTKK